MLELLTSETPNGWKAAIMLEELGVPYKVTPISLTDRVQKEDWYVALNPNGRIPTLVDHDAGGFAVFESGAILIYLAEKFGRFLPADAQGRSTVIQWVMWQMAGLGPMMGQATVFNRYFEEKLPAVIDRYVRESRRLLRGSPPATISRGNIRSPTSPVSPGCAGRTGHRYRSTASIICNAGAIRSRRVPRSSAGSTSPNRPSPRRWRRKR